MYMHVLVGGSKPCKETLQSCSCKRTNMWNLVLAKCKKNGVDEITHYSDQFSLSWVLQMTKTNT